MCFPSKSMSVEKIKYQGQTRSAKVSVEKEQLDISLSS